VSGVSTRLIDSVVTKGKEMSTGRAIALKKLITHNPRDGVRIPCELLEPC
jgi:hypothetical protein